MAEKESLYFCPFSGYNNYKNSTVYFTVFEDWWVARPAVVKSKIHSIFGKSNRLFARKCKVLKINKLEANAFLDKHHIYGAVQSKLSLGLFYKNELVAVCSFAHFRNLRAGKSGELLRFSNKNNFTVVGGLSKMLKAYSKMKTVDNIMTYSDNDWGSSKGFEKIGFQEVENKEVQVFFCSKLSGKRVAEKHFIDFENIEKYEKVNNSGAIKWVLEY